MAKKYNILLVGGGGIGTMTAVNLEASGLADVSMVLRSNYKIASENGFTIHSVDHGDINNWKPHKIIPAVPNAAGGEAVEYDFIVCATKNTPDIKPTVADILTPAVTPGKTVIVLVQNGLNIEKPLIEAFPNNIVLSGVSMMGSHEVKGVIKHDDNDKLLLGAFENPNVESAKSKAAAQEFVELYQASGKVVCEYQENVGLSRWRKLIYNACLNPICAILQVDTGRLRLAGAAETLARPAMEEIKAAAAAFGYILPDNIATTMIDMDPVDMYFSPSMCVDVSKGNYIEFETILGEALRDGTSRGVPMPTINILYHLAKTLQWRTMVAKGLVTVPPKGKYA